MAKAVYVHIPFCKHICSYCDFCKFVYNEKWVYAYLKALKNEIKDRYMDDEITTLYVGGGTPSCLSIQEIENLMHILMLLNLSKLEEFTFECNIEDINIDLLNILRKYNVNRLSIGIESFNPQNLEFMERRADFKDACAKIKLCRDMGFNNINIDLIYAIPNEKIKDLKNDINLILKLQPNHISTYSLMIEEHTKLKNEDTSYIDEELDYDMFILISKLLKSYNHYELSNFALDGYESKHNLVYWNNEEYYGFGLSASGYLDGVRYTNTKNLKKYLLGDVVEEREIVTQEAKMNYEVMLGLRKLNGINITEFKEKYGVDIESVYDLKPLYKNRDLIKKKDHIFINPDKLYVMNEILLKII